MPLTIEKFQQMRNLSNITNSVGIATFELRLTRADPSARIRLLFTGKYKVFLKRDLPSKMYEWTIALTFGE